MKKICPTTLLVFMLILVLMSVVQAQSSQQTLTQYISDLQKNPNDYCPAGEDHQACAGNEACACDTGRGKASLCHGQDAF